MLDVEVEGNLLQNRLRVRAEHRVDSALDERLLELLGIGDVEVADKHQVAGGPCALAGERMAGVFVVRSARSVAQMADEQLGGVIEIALYGLGKFGVDYPRPDFFIINFELVGEDFGEPVGICVALAEYVIFARGNPYLDRPYSGAVLPPVVLLFHEQKELVEAVQWGSVLFLIVFQGFQEPDYGNAAFVFDRVAHIKYASPRGVLKIIGSKYPPEREFWQALS